MPKPTFDDPLCPRCGERVQGCTDDDNALAIARAHQYQGCRYVDCDDLACRALDEPLTTSEYRDALTHWRRHSVLSGCSHGR